MVELGGWGALCKSILALLILGSALLEPCVCVSSDEKVEVWLTTGDGEERLNRSEISFNPVNATDSPIIVVLDDENHRYQKMEGFGAAMTDSSAWLLYELKTNDSDKYWRVMNKLFNNSSGINISYIRLPMGASDFALYSYTYDNMSNGQVDPTLENFSINHDREYIIPVLQDAINITPQIKFMASPWSAPAWMKNSNNLNGGSLNPEYYEAYAKYFVYFIQNYTEAGIPIDSITVQNEPQNKDAIDYPSMVMDWQEQNNFVIYNLGPKFREENISTKILIWDHICDNKSFAFLEILNNSTAKNFVYGTAWHGYYGGPDPKNYTPGIYISQAFNATHKTHPDKHIYFTERSASSDCLIRGFSASDLVWWCREIFIPATRNWSETVLMWNMVLDEKKGPQNGGCDICFGLITINTCSNGEPYIETEYYVLGHFSKFVDRGASRIESTTSEDLKTVAFKNQDHSIVLIVLNNNDTNPKPFDVQWHDQHFSYELQKQSIVTFIWNQTATD